MLKIFPVCLQIRAITLAFIIATVSRLEKGRGMANRSEQYELITTTHYLQ